jgi:hypothetical protein
MKTTIILSLMVLARQVTASRNPELQWDPETAEDCVEWYNNSKGESCEYVRSYFGITPEQFHKWNPSLSLDCEPWDYQSYCIVTLERLEEASKTKTTSTTTTSTAPTLGPSPTSWTDLGCYAEDPELPILEKNMSQVGGDGSLTVPQCQDACYRARYKFAGVQEGNQCWCSSYVGGEWTNDQADCNSPCSGDTTTFCGGKGVLYAYRADAEWAPIPNPSSNSSSSTAITTTATAASSTSTVVEATDVVEARSTSGAVRNLAIF